MPPAKLWREPLVMSRLLEGTGAWTRIHALGLARSHGELIRQVTTRLAFLELVPPVLARALEPFPVRAWYARCASPGFDPVPARSKARGRAGQL